MAELVAGAFLSSSLQVAFERLASGDIIDYFRAGKLKDGTLLKKLDMTLNCINKVIEDAEERQYRDHYVKQWLDELKDVVFQAEDLLDDIAAEASRQKLQLQLHPATGKLRNFVTRIASPFDKQIERRIKELVDYLEFLANKGDRLGLKEGSYALTQVEGNRKLFKRLPATCLIDEANIFGRDTDKEKIIEILSSNNKGENQLPVDVVAIVSMGGMGKTTLARLIFEDKRIKEEFQHRAWVFISEEFDVGQATKVILEALDCRIKISDDLNLNQLQMKKKLKDKKFFLVLDDVWNQNRTIWEVFQTPFNYGAPGSKILITTRNKKVAEVMRSSYMHLLKPLEDEDCWKLFVKYAFKEQHQHADPNLLSIGRDIVKKCGGLPLAIKTLGSLLHTKPSSQDWVSILESDIWHLPEDDSNIIPSLRLSYHCLPSNLKRCFAFCSLFPKEHLLKKDVLIQLWMAEGLLHSTQKSKSIEKVGDEVFNDLESRSFFEPQGDYFIMHDLLNDLAMSVVGEFCVRLEVDQAQDISKKARYFSYLATKNEKLEIFEDVFLCHQLRSFIRLDNDPVNCDIKNDMISRLTCFKYMRVLSLRGNQNFKRLTADISNLKHLHYLDLSDSAIENLPNSLCLMVNLQTLKLKGCVNLTTLPSNFHTLTKLRHLDLENSGIKMMPKHMGKLKHLQTMNWFVVGNNGGSDLKELGALYHLGGTLTISNMKSIDDPTNIKDAKLKEKHMDELNLIWGSVQSHEESQRQECVLEALEPNSNIKKLTVTRFSGTVFPNWFDGLHLPSLVSLSLSSCSYCLNLPPLGQLPSLQKLEIQGFHGIRVIDQDFYGNGSSVPPFHCLSYLKFSWMREWEEWNICHEDGSFSCLQELYIWDCPRLTKSLPQHLPSLKRLDIMKCISLKTTLPKATALEMLRLQSCKKISMKDSPTWSSTDVLPHLHDLILCDCPEMESIPPGGMLSSLQRLSVSLCPKLIVSRKDWCLHEILSLEELEISDKFEDVESFPEEGLLPPNLHSLSFKQCYNLKRINYKGLLHLRFLTSLYFDYCPGMSFEGLPDDGLPATLSHLQIGYNCTLLKQRCQREIGQDWPKIAHIPHVHILGRRS
ncbi:putative disease resistance RPP13-like protein 1 [Prosopis cineraria]|uniref:putative disease resistance RPP13-like protein 1 n=1 Tax=Prosopis cineraria TaxID=364024 RepID=UPI00240EC8A9|nr:putative disease resistance RPP13-like protein 1 [Prosopis cineraria]